MFFRKKKETAVLRKALLLACVSLLLPAACVVPDKFTAEYTIRPDGTYNFTYEGTMVDVLARAVALEAREKNQSPGAKVGQDIREVREALKQDPRIKSFQEEAEDLYRVRVEESGNLKEKEFLPFFSHEVNVWFLQYDRKSNTASFNITPFTDKSLADMDKLNLAPDGEIKFSTACRLVSSNVELDRSFFGSAYSFKIRKAALKEGVKIVLQLE